MRIDPVDNVLVLDWVTKDSPVELELDEIDEAIEDIKESLIDLWA